MPAPKKIARKLEGGGRGSAGGASIARKPVVKVKPKSKGKLKEPTSNVKDRKDPFAGINAKPKPTRNKPTGSNVKVVRNPFAGL